MIAKNFATVSDLLAEMTLDEKMAQLGGIWVTDLLDDRRQFSPGRAQSALQHGVGQITRLAAASFLGPKASARLANDIQKYLVEQTRLRIPAIVHEESCAGYLAREATTFPQAIGQAATWDVDLIQVMATVIRQQMRAVGAHHALAPVLDIVRDPRWGRVEETYGEDPFLVSALGTAYVKGLQSENLREGIAATGKHFVGYGMSEGGMNWAPAHIPERELREVFLTPFLTALRNADLATVMNAYHELDGVPCGSSKALMVDLLRGELGFRGVVVADYFTLDTLATYHHVAKDKAEAARLGLEAGIDIELPAHDCYAAPLRQALEAGEVDLALIDASVERILLLKQQLGLFDNPYVDADRAPEVFHMPEQRDLTRTIALKSIVLLKNDNLLPLSPDIGSVAVIGPSANSIRLLQGDYHYPTHMEGFFEAQNADLAVPTPHEMQGFDDFEAHFPPSVSVLNGIKAQVCSETRIHYAKGCGIVGDDRSGFAEAIAAAQQADVAVMVVGGRSGLAPGSTCGESLDRADLGLPGVQQALVEAIHATGTPVVVVLLNGRPLAIPWITEHVPAIVEAWLPAQEGGNAVAQVLFGQYNPGGKLPMSFPRTVGQVPVYYNHKPSGGRTHWQGDYVDSSTSPLFAFGHGLSYTQFTYSDLRIDKSMIEAEDTVRISVKVTNSGAMAGDEVVQLYVHDRIASVTRPVKELKGFARITLQPGEAKMVTFAMPIAHLGFYGRQMRFVVEPGEIDVMVGSSSTDIRLKTTFEIVGATMEVARAFSTHVEIT